MIRNSPSVRDDFPAPVRPTIPTLWVDEGGAVTGHKHTMHTHQHRCNTQSTNKLISLSTIKQWNILNLQLASDLLSSVNVDGDVANGRVQIVAVTQAEASDVYVALSGPAWGEAGGLVFPLCLVIRGYSFKLAQ